MNSLRNLWNFDGNKKINWVYHFAISIIDINEWVYLIRKMNFFMRCLTSHRRKNFSLVGNVYQGLRRFVYTNIFLLFQSEDASLPFSNDSKAIDNIFFRPKDPSILLWGSIFAYLSFLIYPFFSGTEDVQVSKFGPQ